MPGANPGLPVGLDLPDPNTPSAPELAANEGENAASAVAGPFEALAQAIESGIVTSSAAAPEALHPARAAGFPRFHATDLDCIPIPEGRSLVKPEILQSGLKKLEDNGSPVSKVGKIKLQCPVSGGSALLALQQQVELEKQAAKEKELAAIAADDDDDKGSKKSASESRKSGSRKSGSRKSGSKNQSKKSSNVSSGRGSRRRGRKIPTFSEWEADNYIPIIKSSWTKLTQLASPEKISHGFYDMMLEKDPKFSKLFNALGKPKMASHIWSALQFISVSVDDPPELPNKCRELVAIHVESEVSNGDIKTFGIVLIQMLELFLGKEYDVNVRTAWAWLWTWLEGVMCMVMDEALEESSLISQTVDIMMDNYPGTRFGELIFDMLFSLAPNLKSVFPSPKQLLSVKFSEMISTLVTFAGDQATMDEQIVWLGVRHVGYGARDSHTKVFGQVIMNSLERACGDEWTAEAHKVWMELWESTCQRLFEITAQAEEHGNVVQELWANVQASTTQQKFGKALRESLLAGTEWVQSLSVGIQEGLDDAILSKEERDRTREKLGEQRRASMSQDKDGIVGRNGLEEDETKSKSSKTSADILMGKEKDKDKQSDQDSDAIGNKFWDMITELMTVIWEPERMNEKIIIMTTRLYAVGIRPDNIDTIGKGIGVAIKKTLGGQCSEQHLAAWTWFWGMTSRSMRQVLTCLVRDDASLILDRWEECKSTKPVEELGELIFLELGRLAPHIVHLFKKPKGIQALQFVSAIDIIVGFNQDPVNFFEILRPLAIRHIRYGVKADYARAFGKAVLRSIKTCLGERYDQATSLAFDTLWLRVSCCVTRALAAGSNLVAVALINEDIDQMVSAMDGTPRGERFKFLTSLDLNGESFSPLYWSIKESQLEISKFIMGDLLAIRADRHTYYYGREVMWKTHPDLMVVLCKDMPLLLPTLFDGMLWHARIVWEGAVRVNYYLREMYGDPREVDDPWEGPMGVMVTFGEPENFLHPVVEKLLELKFNRFGRKMFIALQAYYTLILIMYVAFTTILGSNCDDFIENMRKATLALGAFTVGVQVILMARQFSTGQFVRMSPLRIPVPRYLFNPWNITRFVSLCMLIAVRSVEPCSAPENIGKKPREMHIEEWRQLLSAFTGFLLIFQFMQVLIISSKLSALVYTIGCMIPDIMRTLGIIILLLCSFSAAFTSLRIPLFGDPAEAMAHLTQIILGVADENTYLLEGWGLAFIISALIMIVIGMLNILVAQLVLSYANLTKQEKAFSMLNRAYICVEMESFLPQNIRRKFYDELGFDSPLEFDKGDEGPPGGVQARMPSSIRVDEKYIPDRILRFTGESSPMDPWPSSRNDNVEDLSVQEGEEEAAAEDNTAV